MPVDTAVRLADGDHVVQYYNRDDDLVRVAGGFLSTSLLDGDVVVVIAVPEHRAAFRTALVAAGVDVEAAEVDGALTMLDAAETLARFTVDGTVDFRGCGDVIGGIVDAAIVRGSRVRIYGEMVALLWAGGHVADAIELETLWDQLATRLPFSVFCAYPVRIVSDPTSDHFAELCHLHSDVIAAAPVPVGAEATRGFIATTHGPGLARRYVTETLRRWGRVDLLDDAVLIVSELATNAVVHAGSDFTVGLSRDGDGVRIAVTDSSRDRPERRYPGWMATGGWGLRMVDAIAGRRGHDLVDGGKVVWAEVSVRA